jgi:hypothetical protein
MKSYLRNLFLPLAGLALAATAATAAPWPPVPGDLILGVQATGGIGATTNVFYNLGPAHTLRDSPSPAGTLVNLNAELTAAYGAGWSARTDLYFGVFANRSNATPSGIGFAAPENGDPARSIYASKGVTVAGTGVPWSGYSVSALGLAATAHQGQIAAIDNIAANSNQVMTLIQSYHTVEWNNSWTQWNPVPGAAFSLFTGGIQAKINATAALVDVFRIVSTSGSGSYVTTVSLAANGDVTAARAGAATSYYSVTTNATNGSVSGGGSGILYAKGSTAKLTAAPAAGYLFANWTGDASGLANPLTLFMDGNKTVTANFAAPPTVTSPTSTGITGIGATLGGNITSIGVAAVTERGVVYSVSEINNNPLIDGTGVAKVTAAGSTGVFTIPVTGLILDTHYSYKAYATSSQGTSYTSVATFTTLSNNADLSNLELSTPELIIGTLSPNFNSGTTAYTATVNNATSFMFFTPTLAQANATIEARFNGGAYAAVISDSLSTSLPLNVGSNTLEVRVTAKDGNTQKTYTITVTRDKAAQMITFTNPGAQLANATVSLSASAGGSGQPIVFVVESGPAVFGEGNILTFTGAGEVRVRATLAGNSDFAPATDVTHTFDVVLPRPDVAVGLTLDSLIGLRSYGNSGQQLRLVSRFGRPVTGFAALANRTILSDRRAADRLAVRANPGNRFFSITYADVDGNATAGIVSGFYRTPAIDGTDALRWLTARISPNKALLSEKKGKRTVYLRKTFTTRVRASSTLYPPASDAGVIEVLHQ